MPSQRGWNTTLLLLGAAWAAIHGCGVDERTYKAEGLYLKPVSNQCADYCEVVTTNCSGPNAVYSTRTICRQACRALELDPRGIDEVGCRHNQALAAATDPSHCPGASFGGDIACGSDCETYCSQYPVICSEPLLLEPQERCVARCFELAVDANPNARGTSGADTIQCRLYHLQRSAVDSKVARDHCEVADIPATRGCRAQGSGNGNGDRMGGGNGMMGGGG